MRKYPKKLNVSDLAEFYGTTRQSIYNALEKMDLQSDTEKRFKVFDFDFALQEQQPYFLDSENKSPGALWHRFYRADTERYRSDLNSKLCRPDESSVRAIHRIAGAQVSLHPV